MTKIYNVSGQGIRIAGIGHREHGEYWDMTQEEAIALAGDKRFSTSPPKVETKAKGGPLKEGDIYLISETAPEIITLAKEATE